MFDDLPPGTVGVEEEVLLLDPDTCLPVPVGAEVVERAAAPGRIKNELPACQVELRTDPHPTVDETLDELRSARRALAVAVGDRARPAAAAVHPTAAAETAINDFERYEALACSYGSVLRRQLVGSLQVHVAVGGADRTRAVFNALRGQLPLLLAISAAAPFHDGRDTGCATARPLIAGQLPRQGVPPAIESWDAFAADLEWGRRAGTVSDGGQWWWELRPHVRFGTLEVRVPDVQPTLAGADAIVRLVTATARHLARRHDEGLPLGSPVTWRITENRWSALRHGLDGHVADLTTGQPCPTRTALLQLVDQVEPDAEGDLDAVRRMASRPVVQQMREVGLHRSSRWLADQFLVDCSTGGPV